MNGKDRKLTFSMDRASVVIRERTAQPLNGARNRKWTDDTVYMTVEELEKALDYARKRGKA